jgi:hypothetical protein
MGMITRYPTPKQRHESGMALVIVLTFVVLLVGLIVAFFSRAMVNQKSSNYSFHQSRVDELARGALDLIKSDLKQEIVEGSTASKVGDVTLYIPKSPAHMTPVRNAEIDPVQLSTLLRVSSTGILAAPGVDHPASNVETSVPSANGVRVPRARWNASYLIERKPDEPSGSLEPVDEFPTPKWVYVTDDGPVALASADQATVVGRYAYVIHDQGGLLDLNTAGYPMEPAGILPLNADHTGADPTHMRKFGYGAKGALAFADLTYLGLSEKAVTSIVGWRNYASIQPDGDLSSFVFNTTSAQSFFDWVYSNSNGFLKVGDSVWKNSTDQAVLSRQQLIALQKKLVPQGFPDTALRYLSTFSRAVTGPTWTPPYDASELGGDPAFNYKTAADDPGSINRNVLGVRHRTAGQIVHYRDDGTQELYEVAEGDPLLRTPFSLAKLAWIGHSGPNAAAFNSSLSPAEQASAIKACFGLTWNATKKRWDYEHGDDNDILTLEQVLSQKREPDFFEILKAGILDGSLGGHPGEVSEDINHPTDPTKWAGPVGRDYEVISADPDRHVLQIGVNMIDQADQDNYPTAIYKETEEIAGVYPEEDLYFSVFGLENLPLLTRMGMITAYLPDHNTTNNPNPESPGTTGVWLQPEVWNPHDSSTADPSKYPTPSSLRLVTYGSCFIEIHEGEHIREGTPNPINFGFDPMNPNVNGIVCFKNPWPVNPYSYKANAPFSFFNNPIRVSGYSNPFKANYEMQDTTSPSGPRNRYPDGATPGTWDQTLNNSWFLGVFLGEAYRDPATYLQHRSEIKFATTEYLTFALEYYDGSAWRPYCTMARLYNIPANSWGSGTRYGQARWGTSTAHPDPRTSRFSTSATQQRAGNNNGWYMDSSIRPTSHNNVMLQNPEGRGPVFWAWPRSTAGFHHKTDSSLTNTDEDAYLLDEWLQNVPSTGSTYFYYEDPDKIVRPGDGWRADHATGDGVMLYHVLSTPTNAGTTYLPDSKIRRRPVILNRPFRSVGELGYVFRDQPFKTLDFSSDKSADTGLLDLFSVRDEPPVTAGRLNPQNAPIAVLQSLIGGSLKHEGESVEFSGAEADAAAGALHDSFAQMPLVNRGDIVMHLNAITYSDTANTANKPYAEGPVRALASVSNVRTWNLLIDVIAQSGRFRPGAVDLGSDFIVQGERRYWLHLAIDRFTGEIVDQQLEPVYE